MKLKVERKELQDRLSDVQSVVERKVAMPVLSHVLIEASSGAASIKATDIEMSLRVPLEADVEADGALCVPARKLLEIVREVAEDVSIEEKPNSKIEVKAGQAGFVLSCLPAAEFPAWAQVEDPFEFEVDAAVMRTMLERTYYACGAADSRYALNGLLFHTKGGSLTVVGTDGHRMAVIRREMPVHLQAKKSIVPRKAAGELKRLLAGEKVQVAIGKGHAQFIMGGVELVTRLIDGTYPNYGGIIPEANGGQAVLGRVAFGAALRRVSLMNERGQGTVLDIKPGGTLRLRAAGGDLGEAWDEVAMEYEGEPLKVGFNAGYLIEALGAMASERVVFELKDHLSPTVLREAEGDEDYKCVVMPSRT